MAQVNLLINLLIGILSAKGGQVLLNEEMKTNIQLNLILKDLVSANTTKNCFDASTLKENIILNKEFDENKFKEILKSLN